MKTYYLIVINLAIALFLMSCESESGESPPITLPRIKVINEQNQDLLDATVAGYYPLDEITVWTMQDGIRVNGIVEISSGHVITNGTPFNLLVPGFYYIGSLFKEPTDDIDFYLSLTETDVDTITMVISTQNGYSVPTEVLINDQVVNRGALEYYYTIVK